MIKFARKRRPMSRKFLCSSRQLESLLRKLLLGFNFYARTFITVFVEIEKTNQVRQTLAFYKNGSVKCIIKVFRIGDIFEISPGRTNFSEFENMLEPLGCAVEVANENIHC